MIKRVLSTIMVATMLVSTMFTTVFAGGDFSVTAASVTAKAGETVNVTVSLANNPGIIAMRLKVSYNSDALSLTNIQDAGILGTESHTAYEENDVTHYDLTANPYILYWHNDESKTNFEVNGTVATLTFKVNDSTAVGDYPITIEVLDCFETSTANVACAAINGKVTVEEDAPQVLVGDVNGDNKVNAMDRTFLARHIAKWDGYGEANINYAAADVDGNGKVNALDRTILARHIAKWEGYEVLPKK